MLLEVFIVQQIIFREVIKCLGSFFQIIQFCPMFKSFSIACGDIGGNIDIQKNINDNKIVITD